MGDLVLTAISVYDKVEEEKRRERETVNQQRANKAKRQLAARIRASKHLLDNSKLKEWFPDVDFVIDEAGEYNGRPTVWVREKGDNHDPLIFRVDSIGVYIDYTSTDYGYGWGEQSKKTRVINGPYDVGAHIRFLSEQMDESYRRNPD